MPAQLHGEVMKNHSRDLKCDLYEWNLSKDRDQTAWAKERRRFAVMTSGLTREGKTIRNDEATVAGRGRITKVPGRWLPGERVSLHFIS